MATSRDPRLDSAVEAGLDSALVQLTRFCRQPSIAAQNQGMEESAELMASLLREHGLEARIIPLADGYPVVYGEAAGRSDRTMLFYNHYDVQPPEPFDLWDSPPFEPTLRDGQLFARGVSDDKGQTISRLAALDAVRELHGGFPCRIKFLVEGEEEIGSPHLASFVAANRDLLKADACIWESGGINDQGRPLLTLGMRGICTVDFSVRTISRDAHSGTGGSFLPNAAWRIAWALASLKGVDERILIPGFYDDVLPPSERDIDILRQMPDEEEALRQTYGVDRFLNGLTGLDLRQSLFNPTCTINGLTSGYHGPGMKTVLPGVASAKVDFRLVPHQDPEDVYAKLRRHLDTAGFADVETRCIAAEHPARVDPDHPFTKLAVDTAEYIYGRTAVISPMSGGTGPIYPFVELLGLPIASVGISYPDGRIHAPNENIRIADFVRGTQCMAYLLDRFARE